MLYTLGGGVFISNLSCTSSGNPSLGVEGDGGTDAVKALVSEDMSVLPSAAPVVRSNDSEVPFSESITILGSPDVVLLDLPWRRLKKKTAAPIRPSPRRMATTIAIIVPIEVPELS